MTILNGYATLAQVKNYLRIVSVDSTDDTVIEDLVEKTSRLIDRHTGRQFFASTATRVFTAQESSRVALSSNDLLTVSSLKTDLDGDRVYETTLTAGTDYDLYPLNLPPYSEIKIAPLSVHYFSLWAKGIEIVGTWGYTATAPEDIEYACLVLTEMAYKERFIFPKMTDEVSERLNVYRRIT